MCRMLSSCAGDRVAKIVWPHSVIFLMLEPVSYAHLRNDRGLARCDTSGLSVHLITRTNRIFWELKDV